MIPSQSLEIFEQFETPFYFYNINLLNETLKTVQQLSARYGYTIHYAIKANSNQRILREIASFGFGADCVSGNEIKMALECGFDTKSIVFAGVGKTDREIEFALEKGILCFHCESIQELQIVNSLAEKVGEIAQVALRINPNVEAKTHAHITTGLSENKFGLNLFDIPLALNLIKSFSNINLIGTHYHIGSQICDLKVFEKLSQRINEIHSSFFQGFELQYINVGGGLGIDYQNPMEYPTPQFSEYFKTFNRNLRIPSNSRIHFELGRSIVGQCGSLITRVLYVKGDENLPFLVVDAGMNDLLRPALYGASHKIINLSSALARKRYNVVGPVCESADCFAKQIELPETSRGNLLAILSCGAYGEAMGSQYNLREKTGVVFSDELVGALHS
jgi:diaminopimelate decarboxylase